MALITKAQVVSRAMTNANFDTHLIKNTFIDISELNHLKTFLGCDLYDTMSEESNNGIQWVDETTDSYLITCAADSSGSLDLNYISIYSSNNENKYAVFFQITDNTTILATPTGHTGVIAVDVTGTGEDSSAQEVSEALEAALNLHEDFVSDATGGGICKVYGLQGASQPEAGTAGFSVAGAVASNGGYLLTAGSVTIGVNVANSFIEVGDFVSGYGIPYNSQVVTVDTPGAVTSITINQDVTLSHATASLTFKKPYGALRDDYILDYLAFCVKFEILPDITYNTTSQGVVDNIADFTSPVNERKLNYLRQETYKKAETFKKKMHSFLDKNASNYPLWNGCGGGCNSCKTGGGNVSKRHGIITY